MTFRQIFEKAKEQLGKDNLLFKFFLERIIRVVNDVSSNPRDWQDRKDISQKDAIDFYNCALGILFELATGFAHTTDDPVYEEATQIVAVLRTILITEFAVELEEVQIMSPSRMMEARGLVEIVEDAGGEEVVRLTQEGERVAQEVDDLIRRSHDSDN